MGNKMSVVDGWKKTQLGEVATLVKGISYESKDYCDAGEGSIFITIKCVSKAGGFKGEGLKYFKGSITTSQVLQPGELLIANTDLTRAGDIVGCPMVVPAISGATITMSMDLSKVVEDDTKIDRDFLYYKLMTDSVRRFMKDHASGSTVLHLQTRAVPGLELEIPTSKPEQTKIAEILSTVDRAIDQTEALIAKQQRIKTGLMQDLLTRGIDEHGNLRSEQTHKFKDSPLGRIPIEWEVVKLNELLSEIIDNRGRTPPLEDHSQYELIEISALRGAEKTPNYTEIQKWVSEATFKRWFRQHLNKGDILISTVGSVGLSAFIDIPRGAIAQNLIGLRISPDNCSDFVFYWSRTHEFQKEIRKVVMDAVQPSLKRPHLLSFMIKRPPLPEQQLISYKLNSATTATINAQLCFHKLRSLKTAIMQDLLTGKKRVTALLKETTKL